MTNGIQDVIKKLEQQRAAIERALAALRAVDADVEGTDAEDNEAEGSETEAVTAAPRKATKKGGMTAAGRKRLSEALKRRWAAKKEGTAPAPNAKAAASSASSASSAKKTGGMTPEGRKRLSEALRKRWAAKRAAEAGPTKAGSTKKAARK
jgi:hypothetical protein